MGSTGWERWTQTHQALADALDRATGVDVDGGRDLADEENYEGLSVWEREAARELDRMTKVVVEDGDANDARHRRNYTHLSAEAIGFGADARRPDGDPAVSRA